VTGYPEILLSRQSYPVLNKELPVLLKTSVNAFKRSDFEYNLGL